MPRDADGRLTIFRPADAIPGALTAETVAVLGYGHLGRTAALNLRDSGIKVRVGNRSDAYADQALADGFDVVPLSVAASEDIVWVLLPDEVIPDVFPHEVVPACGQAAPSSSARVTAWRSASSTAQTRSTSFSSHPA